jgi:hypothetical protein
MTPLIAQLGDDRARTLAREIVRRPEFSSWRETDFAALPLMSWLQHWLAWLSETLEALALFRPFLYWTIVYGLAAMALLLIAHMVWTLRVALRANTADVGGAAAAAGTDFVALADRLAAAGRFLDAAHYMQLACIEQLLQRRLIKLSRSEPNRTLRRRINGSPVPAAEQAGLMRLLDQTETAWFRDRSQDPALYAGWLDLHRRLCALPAA